MPTIRDGRGQLTVHPSEPPPAVPPGPIERSRVSAARMAAFAAERAAAAATRKHKSSPAVLDDRARAAASRARGAAAAGFVKGATKRGPTRLQAEQRSKLTDREQLVIDKLRETGSRQAVQGLLGAKHLQSIDGTLVNILEKGLLPADLPDLPKRIRLRLPSPAGLTAGEHRRAVAAANAEHEGREAGAPATAAVDRGTTGATPATEVATPPGPTPGIAEEYSAPDSPPPAGWTEMAAAVDAALTPEFTPRPIEGEDRCSFVRVLTPSGIVHVCDRIDGHDGTHRGRMLSIRVTDQVASLLGYTVAVPA